MRNLEHSMSWMSFSQKMSNVAHQLSSSDCPMVFVLPDGREISFADIDVQMFNYKGRRGDTEFDSIGFRVKLLDAQEHNAPSAKESKNMTSLQEVCGELCQAAFAVIWRYGNAGEETRKLAECVDKARDVLAVPS